MGKPVRRLPRPLFEPNVMVSDLSGELRNRHSNVLTGMYGLIKDLQMLPYWLDQVTR